MVFFGVGHALNVWLGLVHGVFSHTITSMRLPCLKMGMCITSVMSSFSANRENGRCNRSCSFRSVIVLRWCLRILSEMLLNACLSCSGDITAEVISPFFSSRIAIANVAISLDMILTSADSLS